MHNINYIGRINNFHIFFSIVCIILWGWLGSYIILSAIFRSQWLSENLPIAPMFSVAFTLTIIVSIWFNRHLISHSITRVSVCISKICFRNWILLCLGIGIILRIGAAMIAPGAESFVSDTAAYWDLAQRLAAGDTYEHARGRSFWPPGLPLLLAPFVSILGSESWVFVFVNLLLYIATTYVALSLAKQLIGDGSARIAVLILAIWPNFVLFSAIPTKEVVVALLLPMSVFFYLRGAEMVTQKDKIRWLNFVGCGICLGFAALTQPATTLFGFIFVGYELIVNASLSQKVSRLAIAGVVTVLTVLPWTARNYAVHGEFIPINTAGGIVFYAANNANASGGWIPDHHFIDSEIQLAREQGDEILENNLAYKKAFAWIKENKLHFLKLIVLKQTRFLCCDDTGAFIFNHPSTHSVSNLFLHQVFALISNAFWILLALLILYGALGTKKLAERNLPIAVLTLFSIYYLLTIFSFFESESKQHTQVVVFLALMASCAFQPKQSESL